MQRPPAPPEAELLRRARLGNRPKLSIRAAARLAGVSEVRWRQIEAGYETRGDVAIPARATDGTLAHMAAAVDVSPQQLTDAGREDAALVLVEILRHGSRASAGAGTAGDAEIHLRRTPGASEAQANLLVRTWRYLQVADDRQRDVLVAILETGERLYSGASRPAGEYRTGTRG